MDAPDFSQSIKRGCQSRAGIIPAGTYHYVINASKKEKLLLYTLDSPPNHPDGTVHKTKAGAEEAEKHEHQPKSGWAKIFG